jgi:hypothetical protein
VAHEALNWTSDRDKNAGRVCFLVQERKLQVELPAQRETIPLTCSSTAGEGQSHLDKRRIALGEQAEKPS